MTGSNERRLWIRRLAIEELARHDVQVSPAAGDSPGRDDRLEAGSGAQYHLYNLQQQCSSLPDESVEAAVAHHFAQGFAAAEQPTIDQLSQPEFLAQLRTRLQPPDTSGTLAMTYARPAFDGLVVELCRDLPTTVHTLGDDALEGRDTDFLFQVGQANTDAEPATTQSLDDGVTALYGESFFIASKALNMSAVVSATVGRAEWGVLFSVPHRSLLFIHPVGSNSTTALGWLASATLAQTRNGSAGLISADTYFWQGGHTQRITRIEPDAPSIEIVVDGAFAEALHLAEHQ